MDLECPMKPIMGLRSFLRRLPSQALALTVQDADACNRADYSKDRAKQRQEGIWQILQRGNT